MLLSYIAVMLFFLPLVSNSINKKKSVHVQIIQYKMLTDSTFTSSFLLISFLCVATFRFARAPTKKPPYYQKSEKLDEE